MSDKPETVTIPPVPDDLPPPEKSPRNLGVLLRNGVIALFVIMAVLMAIAVVASAAGGAPFAEVVRIVRDMVIIFLVLEGALIILALAILILQIARLVNLLQSEVKPLLDNTQATVETMRGTVEFMSENVTGPVIKTSAFLTSVSTLFSSAFGLQRALNRARADAKAIEKKKGNADGA